MSQVEFLLFLFGALDDLSLGDAFLQLFQEATAFLDVPEELQRLFRKLLRQTFDVITALRRIGDFFKIALVFEDQQLVPGDAGTEFVVFMV